MVDFNTAASYLLDNIDYVKFNKKMRTKLWHHLFFRFPILTFLQVDFLGKNNPKTCK